MFNCLFKTYSTIIHLSYISVYRKITIKIKIQSNINIPRKFIKFVKYRNNNSNINNVKFNHFNHTFR